MEITLTDQQNAEIRSWMVQIFQNGGFNESNRPTVDLLKSWIRNLVREKCDGDELPANFGINMDRGWPDGVRIAVLNDIADDGNKVEWRYAICTTYDEYDEDDDDEDEDDDDDDEDDVDDEDNGGDGIEPGTVFASGKVDKDEPGVTNASGKVGSSDTVENDDGGDDDDDDNGADASGKAGGSSSGTDEVRAGWWWGWMQWW